MNGPGNLRLTLLAALYLSVAACGGGGGGTTPPPAAPAISYGAFGASTAQFTFTTHTAVSLTPNNTGGAADSWTVVPSLPEGLLFNAASGAITGAPTIAFAPGNFTVTAANAGGMSHATLTLSANAALLNLGNSCFIDLSGAFQQGTIAITSTNLLTLDCGPVQHWVLWNYASGAIVAQGNSCPLDTCSGRFLGGLGPNAELAGQIAVVPYTSALKPGPVGFEIVSASDGSTLATVAPGPNGISWYRASSDGSYVCGALADGGNLTVWAPDGSVALTHSGDYRSAHAYCSPGQILVASGPKGASVIESVAVPGGDSAVSPGFAGTFNSWFRDGSGFFTNVGTTVWVYSPAAVQQDMRALASVVQLAGWNGWFWTNDTTTLNIYKVGASATPAASFATGPVGVIPSGSTIAILASPLRVIDLSGATPTETDHNSPVSDVYAAVSASQWVTGGADGVVYGVSPSMPPRYFGYGHVLGIAGSGSRFAIGTSIGTVLIFNASDLSLETTLSLTGNQLAMSADGSVLAALTAQPNSVSTLTLPAGTVINTWANPGTSNITLSSSGALLGQTLAAGCQVTSSSSATVLWSDSACQGPVRLSLDDTLIAASDGTNTRVFLNDVLSTAISGVAVGWLQNNDLYVNGAGGGAIFDAQGIKQTSPNLPTLNGPLQVLGTTAIFDESSNSIYSLSTGARTWSAPQDVLRGGVVSGSQVVYTTLDNQVVTQPF